MSKKYKVIAGCCFSDKTGKTHHSQEIIDDENDLHEDDAAQLVKDGFLVEHTEAVKTEPAKKK